jgi:hypothetical protein
MKVLCTRKYIKLGVVAYPCNASGWKMEIGRGIVKSLPGTIHNSQVMETAKMPHH